ncbi:MAG: gliding motility-associated C-terminal domain-containing protein [Bacteroidia bacterium]|nr:gliding motility-associated C-terminal domain-containing protein [Bacteroidia bacterium]
MRNTRVFFNILLLILLLFLSNTSYAWHIAGAELTYRCLGDHRYEINLKMYRDCSRDGQPNVAGWDDPIYLYIFTSKTKQRFRVIPISKPPIQKVIPENAAACVFSLPEVCLEQGVYRTVIELPPLEGGYDIAWARCCRNENVVNLFQSRERGVTFLAHVPGPEKANCNSMPVFNDRPPLFICANKEFHYDHSAKDPDGDSLVYAITNPYDSRNQMGLGASSGMPVVGPNNPMGPPDYINTPFNRGYSFYEPFGRGGVATIEPNTGFLRLRPVQPGLYVIAISVFEYRKGVLLSENKRDMQFVVISCKDFPAKPLISKDLSGYEHIGDTLLIDAESNFCVPFTVRDTLEITASLRARVVGVGALQGIQFEVKTWGNPLHGDVCWKPGCNWIGKTIPIVVQGRNTAHCPYYNYAYDTLWVKVRPKPPVLTRLKLEFPGNVVDKNTVMVNLNATACVQFEIEALDWNAHIVFSAEMLNFQAGDRAQVDYQHLGNRIVGKVCWRAQCAALGDKVGVVLKGSAVRECRQPSRVQDTIYFQVLPPRNPKPHLQIRLASGQVIPLDTLVVWVNEPLCLQYQLRDSLPASRLQILSKIMLLPDTAAIHPSPQILPPDVVSPLEIKGKICYQPNCKFLNSTLAIVVIGYDFGLCKLDHIVAETLFIKIREPYNPKPLLRQHIPSFYPRIGDTLLVWADSNLCYAFTLRDSLPISRHQFTVLAEDFYTTEHSLYRPQLWIETNQNDTLVKGKICWKAECKFLNKTVRLILTVKDFNTCQMNYLLQETLLVRIRQPFNPKPRIKYSLPSNLVWQQDTLLLVADSTLCIEVTLEDQNPASKLYAGAKIENLSGTSLEYQYFPIVKVLPQENDTTVVASICWKAPCNWLGKTIRITPWGLDSSTCTLGWIVWASSLYVKIVERKLAPIHLQTYFEPYPYNNDTVIFWVKRNNCIQVQLIDTINKGNLELKAFSPVLLPFNFLGNVATLLPNEGKEVIMANFCWQPSCTALGKVIPVYLQGNSMLDCALAPVTIQDTFYIYIKEPINRPPYFEWQLSQNKEPLRIGIEYCYSLKLFDPDTFTILSVVGKSPTFDKEYGAGSGVKVSTSGSNPLNIELCFKPNCHIENMDYFIKLCGYDSSLCTQVDSTCTSLNLKLDDCRLSFINVFTPNRDGINDFFLPIEMQGIEKYELRIYNRWGQCVFVGENGQWDGTYQGEEVEEGVYFYVVRFFLCSGNGTKIVGEKGGSITLLR